MPKQFKTARQINKLKITEAAEKLNISQPTLSAWEGERKSPSIDSPRIWLTFTVSQPISCWDAPKARTRIPNSQFHQRPCWLFMAGRYGPLHTDGCW